MQLLLQLLQRQPSFGDVVERSGAAGEVAGGVEFGAGEDFQPAIVTVARPVTRFLADKVDFPLRQCRKARRRVGAVFDRYAGQRLAADAFVDRVAGDFAPRRIEVGPETVGVGSEDHFLEAFDDRTEALFAVGELRFDALALAHQIGHQRRQRFKIVAFRRQQSAVVATQQAGGGAAQGVDGARATGEVVTQAVIRLQ
ncbi:MAG: hypothetical protein AW11_02000 [Candidatus Accumulibacter regalis]|uniref:Uncharacterized protein n=1 Tax=Accumulibacter regalis TaxID=522306 RepID=A0A011QHV7_ACCRE|nr:MAG: hypothetical protein AW11_02000 [Candidatus Accumulibacter regalis]